MSFGEGQEMTLAEWVDRLPETHRARSELQDLKRKVRALTSMLNHYEETICFDGVRFQLGENVNVKAVSHEKLGQVMSELSRLREEDGRVKFELRRLAAEAVADGHRDASEALKYTFDFLYGDGAFEGTKS